MSKKSLLLTAKTFTVTSLQQLALTKTEGKFIYHCGTQARSKGVREVEYGKTAVLKKQQLGTGSLLSE